MANITALLNQRVKKSERSSKMAAMAQQSATGHLSSFAGVFSVTQLSENENQVIEKILQDFAQKEQINIQQDLENLLSITAEVKAINNQAILLHGERIKKAHNILIPYKDGAFTAWLIAAYGNRQTPYNLMQYYDFYESLPKELRPLLETMPRQAVYTLAARNGNFSKKQEIVQNYMGQTKNEILEIIRLAFPLTLKDKRRTKVGEGIIQALEKISHQIQLSKDEISHQQKKTISDLLHNLQKIIK